MEKSNRCSVAMIKHGNITALIVFRQKRFQILHFQLIFTLSQIKHPTTIIIILECIIVVQNTSGFPAAKLKP